MLNFTETEYQLKSLAITNIKSNHKKQLIKSEHRHEKERDDTGRTDEKNITSTQENYDINEMN